MTEFRQGTLIYSVRKRPALIIDFPAGAESRKIQEHDAERTASVRAPEAALHSPNASRSRRKKAVCPLPPFVTVCFAALEIRVRA